MVVGYQSAAIEILACAPLRTRSLTLLGRGRSKGRLASSSRPCPGAEAARYELVLIGKDPKGPLEDFGLAGLRVSILYRDPGP